MLSIYLGSDFLQIKAGDVRILANTSFLLEKKDWSSEIRLHAFKMLQVRASIERKKGETLVTWISYLKKRKISRSNIEKAVQIIQTRYMLVCLFAGEAAKNLISAILRNQPK